MSVKTDLIAARALIDTPEKWCKGSYHGNGSHTSHCILGAARAVAPYWSGARQTALLEALQAQLPARRKGKYLWQWNDIASRTHSDVMALFDRAIEAAE